jgi:hypothetical protein
MNNKNVHSDRNMTLRKVAEIFRNITIRNCNSGISRTGVCQNMNKSNFFLIMVMIP